MTVAGRRPALLRPVPAALVAGAAAGAALVISLLPVAQGPTGAGTSPAALLPSPGAADAAAATVAPVVPEPRASEAIPVPPDEPNPWLSQSAFDATVPPSARLVSASGRSGRIHGVVTRGPYPVPDVRVQFNWRTEDPDGEVRPWYASTISDLAGGYEAELDPDREYLVEVVLERTRSEPVAPIWLTAGSDHEVDLKLVPKRFVPFTVVDPEGRPAGGARVLVWQDDPLGTAGARLVLSAGGGSGRVPADQPCTLVAVLEGFGPGDPVVVVPPSVDAPPPVTLRINRAAFVGGRVRSPDGEPVAGARLEIEASEAAAPLLPGAPPAADRFGEAVALSDRNGLFELGPLHPGGVFTVRCFPDDGAVADVVERDVAAGSAYLDFVIGPAGP